MYPTEADQAWAKLNEILSKDELAFQDRGSAVAPTSLTQSGLQAVLEHMVYIRKELCDGAPHRSRVVRGVVLPCRHDGGQERIYPLTVGLTHAALKALQRALKAAAVALGSGDEDPPIDVVGSTLTLYWGPETKTDMLIDAVELLVTVVVGNDLEYEEWHPTAAQAAAVLLRASNYPAQGIA